MQNNIKSLGLSAMYQSKMTLIVLTGFDMHIHRVDPAILWFTHWALHFTTFDGCQGAIPTGRVILFLLPFYLIQASDPAVVNSNTSE